MTYENKVQLLQSRLKAKASALPWKYNVEAETYETTLGEATVSVAPFAIRLYDVSGDELDRFDADAELYAEIHRKFHNIDAVLDKILAYIK